MKKYLLAFIIGSSLMVTAITMIYNGIMLRRNRGADVPYELIPLAVPFMFGLANMLLYYIITSNKITSTTNQLVASLIVGALLGLLFSLVGRFGLELPEKLYKMKEGDRWKVHPTAMVLYAIIFGVIVFPLNKYILLS